MKFTGKSNETTKSNLTIAYLAAALMLDPIAAAIAASSGDIAHHGIAHYNRRPALSDRHQIADPPFSFACTTDGGLQPGCVSGWIYR